MLVKSCHRSVLKQIKPSRSSTLLEPIRNHFNVVTNEEIACDLLVVGGGAGGCSVAAKFKRSMKSKKIIIIEPADRHYYQSFFTLVGAGVKKLPHSVRLMKDVLPSSVVWLKDRVKQFDPQNNSVYTYEDTRVHYKYMVISCGIELNFNGVSGVTEALESADSGVCSIYSPKFVENTFRTIENLRGGNAIFTFPNSLIKCPGAPLKICFLTEDYTRLYKRRNNITFSYRTPMPTIFAVSHYAKPLVELCGKRNINFNLRTELIAVKPDRKEALFRNMDETQEVDTVSYSMLHVTPPMWTPSELRNASHLVDKDGYLNVDKCTLQHVYYKNIFGLGDCTNLPTSKTAAAVFTQSLVLYKNLSLFMDNRPLGEIYNGYTACPLVTSYGKCILAEFDYEKNPLETLPIDQRKERSFPYYLKTNVLSKIYWLGMKGYWNGPETIRKICHLGLSAH